MCSASGVSAVGHVFCKWSVSSRKYTLEVECQQYIEMCFASGVSAVLNTAYGFSQVGNVWLISNFYWRKCGHSVCPGVQLYTFQTALNVT